MSLKPEEIGQRIAQARERKGWTQMAFALEANVSMSSVQRWERGKLPPVRELIRIAEVLGVATEDLVEPAAQVLSLEEIREQLAGEAARFAALNDRLEELLRERGPPRRAGRSSGRAAAGRSAEAS